VLGTAKRHGVPEARVCATVGLVPRRVRRWRWRLAVGQGVEDRRPGPRHAPHRLLDQEKQAILARARTEAHADASSRILAYQALDSGALAVSPSSVYRTLAADGLTTERGRARRRTPRGGPPKREELTGPNQRWCWDITYLRTLIRYVYLFLYAMLDEWSRKVVAWLVAELESYELGKVLADRALAAEGLLAPEATLPVIVNDRGPSMKAKSLRRFFGDLGVLQLFGRPRTPDDNPFIEAAFRTVKYHPHYPERFAGRPEAEEYFRWFFPWYNHEHLHSGIGHVPPALKHAGLDHIVQSQRGARLLEARNRRLEINRRASGVYVVRVPSPDGS
jgi:transposase InsO family protein